MTCDEQDKGAETMCQAIRNQKFVGAVVLVAAGIIAEEAAKPAERPRAPTGSTKLAFVGLTSSPPKSARPAEVVIESFEFREGPR